MTTPARWAAYRALRAIEARGATLGQALAAVRDRLTDPRDRALASDLVMGTLRWRAALDHVVAHCARRPTDRVDPELLDVLRLGAYQLLQLTRIPAHAVVDEAVNLTRRLGWRRAAGFVNAVLRAVAATRAAPPLPGRPGPGASREAMLDYLSITLSHPRWLVGRWLARYGFEAAERWAQFNNAPAPLTLRANRLRGTRDELAVRLAAAGVDTTPTRYAPDGLVVHRGAPLRTPLAAAGAFVVQDEAAQLVTLLAPAVPGATVLDACAAPGGKTTALAADMENTGLLVAADRRPPRLALLRATLARTGVTCARLVELDLTAPLPFRPVFDLVLADVPCSGLGTIRRDPDIRWRRREEDLPALAAAERRMLEEAARVVRPGGRLVYATCSSEPEENDDVVATFLAGHPEFVLEDPRPRLGARAPAAATLVSAEGYFRPLPFAHAIEAFFAAVCRRTGPPADCRA